MAINSRYFPLIVIFTLFFSASTSRAWVVIRGEVVDERGSPIAGALVETDEGSALTLQDGWYTTSHTAGTFTIVASAPGFSSITVKPTVSSSLLELYYHQSFMLHSGAVKLDSVTPNWGKTNREFPVVVNGNGFDTDTRAFMSISYGNQAAIKGSVDTPDTAESIAIVGDIAFVAAGSSGLQVVDLSDPEDPIIFGEDTPGYACGVTVVDDTAYVADGNSGIQIVDVRNLRSPVVIDSVPTPGYAWDVTVVDNIAYVADGSSGLQIIDLDPLFRSPEIISHIDTPGYAQKVTVVDNIAYVADGYSGLQIIGVTDPENPVLIDTVDTPGYARDVTVVDNMAYVADGDSGLQIIDLSNQNHPRFSVHTPDYASGVAVDSGTAYVADRNSGLLLVDVDYPESASVFASVVTHSTTSVILDGNMAYVTDDHMLGSGLKMIDLSVIEKNNAEHPSLYGSLVTPGSAWGVAVLDNLAFIADLSFGLQIIGLSDPENPVLLDTVDTPGYARDVAVVDNIAYVADGSSGLQIIDLGTEYRSPAIISHIDTPGYAWNVTVVNNIAYVADGGSGLQIIGVTDPENPVLIDTVDTPGYAEQVAVVGNRAYVADGDSGLQIIDVGSPAMAEIIASVDTAGYAVGVSVFDNIAYIADGSNGLQIIDVNNFYSPEKKGSVSTGGYTWAVHVTDSLVFLADDAFGLQVVDADDPDNPLIIKTVSTVGDPLDVVVADGLAFVADYPSGLSIVPVPVELTNASRPSDTDSEMTLEVPALRYPGNYSIRVFNKYFLASASESKYRLNDYEMAKALTLSDNLKVSKAIIVAGWGPHENENWGETELTARFAYEAFIQQGFTRENIRYLSSEDTDLDGDGVENDVYGDSTSQELENTIVSEWAIGADELVIYLVDHGGDNTFTMKRSQSVKDIMHASSLAEWLKELQTGDNPMPGRVVVIIEACYSGSFLDDLADEPESDFNRIVITSSEVGQKSKFLREGSSSFSKNFWDMIYFTGDLVDSFTAGQEAVEGLQNPQLDANGDGLANTIDDEDVIIDRLIGRGGIEPVQTRITDGSKDNSLSGLEIGADFWVEVQSVGSVSSVWAAIVPPKYDPTAEDKPDEIPDIGFTYSDISGKWEGSWDGFVEDGPYRISIYAEDENGRTSDPWFLVVTHNVTEDGYETDNTFEQANTITLNDSNGQFHTIHEMGDEDWVIFYGIKDEYYNIEVYDLGANMNAQIEIYSKDQDGNLELKGDKNSTGGSTDNEFLSWRCPLDGLYYLKVSHVDSRIAGISSYYYLKITDPNIADFPPFSSITGRIMSGGTDIANASVTAVWTNGTLSYRTTAVTASDGTYEMALPEGEYQITVSAPGYNDLDPHVVSAPIDGNLTTILITEKVYPPVAVAEFPLSATACQSFTLDGSRSYDTDIDGSGIISAWEWRYQYEDEPEILLASEETPEVTFIKVGTYEISLVVTDNNPAPLLSEPVGKTLIVQPTRGDVSDDCQVGLEEAINALRTVSGQ